MYSGWFGWVLPTSKTHDNCFANQQYTRYTSQLGDVCYQRNSRQQKNISTSLKIKNIHQNIFESTHRELKNSFMMFAKKWKTSIQG
jgi:hypothetical protein